MTKCCLIIPARLESNRLPGKVVLPIAGKPMLQHVWQVAEKALQHPLIDTVRIATDSEHIAAVATNFGASVISTGQHDSGTDRIAEAIQALALADDDVVINLQADEPLMPVQVIIELAEFAAKQSSDVCSIYAHTTDADIINNPNRVKVVCDSNNQALYFSRSVIPANRDQSLDKPIYRIHYGMYAYRVRLLRHWPSLLPGVLENHEKLEQLRLLEQGHRIAMLAASQAIMDGVDTQADLQRVAAIMESST